MYMIMDYDARFVLARDMGDTKAADDVASVTGEAKRRRGGGGRARHHAEGRRGEPQQGDQDDQHDYRKGVEKKTR